MKTYMGNPMNDGHFLINNVYIMYEVFKDFGIILSGNLTKMNYETILQLL